MSSDLLLCERECTHEDGKPSLATHGRYCTHCWARLETPLTQAGELAQHLIGSMTRSGGGDAERVDSSKDAPLPLSQAAFDDASELYSMLVYWTRVFATALEHPEPAITKRAWRNDRGTIIGLPAAITPDAAGIAVRTLAEWIRHRLDRVLGLIDNADDIEAFTDQISDVWRMNARWPRIEKPSYSKMPCPREDCKAKMAVYPPAFPGDARRIVCTAGHWYPEEEYEHLKQVFDQVSTERARAALVAARLAKKYGTGA